MTSGPAPPLVPAACAVVTDEVGRVLLVRRGRAPGQGSWSVPGGRVEPGETLEQAAARETFEETGLHVRVGRELWSLQVPTDDGRVYDVHDFAAVVLDGSLAPGDDADDVRWVHPDELHALPLTPDLLGYLHRAGIIPSGSAAPEAGGRLLLMCGRSFSGKSTAATWLRQALSAEVVSLDAINAERGLAGGQGIPVEEWARTNELAVQRAESALRGGGTVIVDDTASPRFLRDGWRDVAGRRRAVFVLVYVDTPLETIRARLLRNRRDPERSDVVDVVMADHVASFEPPEADEAAVVVDGRSPSRADVVASVVHASSTAGVPPDAGSRAPR